MQLIRLDMADGEPKGNFEFHPRQRSRGRKRDRSSISPITPFRTLNTPCWIYKYFHLIKLKYIYNKDNPQVNTPSKEPQLHVKGIFLMNSIDYEYEVHSQFTDLSYYTQLNHDPTLSFKHEFDSFLLDSFTDGFISQSKLKFLTKEHPSIPDMYILPKVHRSLLKLPGRPKVAHNDSLLEPLSIYLDRYLTTSFLFKNVECVTVEIYLSPWPPWGSRRPLQRYFW